MPTSEKPYHHGNLRAALLNASLLLIREQGSQGFTLREVARRAGVSHTAPYRHFKDREDLLAAVAEEGFLRLARDIEVAVKTALDPLKRLTLAGLAYLTFALDQPEHFQVMFSLQFGSTHTASKEAADAAFGKLVAIVEQCQKAGLLKQYKLATAARIAWAHVHGVADLTVRRQLGFKSSKEILTFANEALEASQFGMAQSQAI